jgi:7-cyano-7-deazaguanine synthase
VRTTVSPDAVLVQFSGGQDSTVCLAWVLERFAHETDYSGYPDCRNDIIKAVQSVLSLGMDRSITIHIPLMRVDKAETFALAKEIGGQALLDLVIEATHSCYLGDRNHRHD